jgi:hypothetical protein
MDIPKQYTTAPNHHIQYLTNIYLAGNRKTFQTFNHTPTNSYQEVKAKGGNEESSLRHSIVPPATL